MRNEIAARRRESVKGLHKQSRSYRFLADDFAEILLLAEDTDATKEGLGPLHLRGPSRCASRGLILTRIIPHNKIVVLFGQTVQGWLPSHPFERHSAGWFHSACYTG